MSEYMQLKTLDIDEDLIRRDQEYYDILVDSIKLEDITSCEQNRDILWRLRGNEWDDTEQLSVVPDYYDDDDLEEY